MIMNGMNNSKLEKFYNRQLQSSSNELNANSRCNCRRRNLCKVKANRCIELNLIYKATVSTQQNSFTYIGSSTNLKIRISNHYNTFRNPNLKNATGLIKVIWILRLQGRIQ